jgi:hypothetical protein
MDMIKEASSTDIKTVPVRSLCFEGSPSQKGKKSNAVPFFTSY